MEIPRKIGKIYSRWAMGFSGLFLLISFGVQISLPRFVSVHHHHEDGKEKHQHAGVWGKLLTGGQADGLDHYKHPHKESHPSPSKQGHLKNRETRLQSASDATGHDHSEQSFLINFKLETTPKQDSLIFQRYRISSHQSKTPSLWRDIHVRGSPTRFSSEHSG